MSTTTPFALTHLNRDQLLARARAVIDDVAPTLRHLSTDELAARAERLVEGVRRHAGRLLADARNAVGDAATSAAADVEQLVAARLTVRIKAKVAPPITAAIGIALLALLIAVIALYRTRAHS